MSTVIKDLEEKLGAEKVEEIIEKEWKVVDPPTAEELAKNPSSHPMARNNPNSRRNLAQYNKRTREAKEKAAQNLKVREKEDDVVPQEIFLGKIEDDIITVFEIIIRPKEVFKTRAEQDIFWSTVKLFLEDFKVKELSHSDFDDIANLAKNRVLEYRLLKAVAKESKDHVLLNITAAREKLSKDNDKIKASLSSRRIDRIDTKNKPALSIVDLAAHLDKQKKLDFQARVKEFEREQVDYLPPLRDDEGNLIED